MALVSLVFVLCVFVFSSLLCFFVVLTERLFFLRFPFFLPHFPSFSPQRVVIHPTEMRHRTVVIALALCVLGAVCAADECSQFTDCESCRNRCRWVITFDCTAKCVKESWQAVPENNATLRKAYAKCPEEGQGYTCLFPSLPFYTQTHDLTLEHKHSNRQIPPGQLEGLGV